MKKSSSPIFVVGLCVLAAVSCGGDSAPTAPSPVPAGASPPPVAAGGNIGIGRQGFAGADAAGAGIAQLAPAPDDFNAYNAQIEYVDGEVTITFVPVDMPGMPDAAREYRNRAVTVRHCPVEPHHVNQRCGEPVFQDSFAFLGSPSRTFTLPECAGWLVIEAAELSDDRYDGWRNAPLACRTDEAGRAVTSVDTDGNGPGWEDSRFDPPARAEPESERVQRVVDEAIAAAAGRFVPGADPVSVSVAELFEDTGGTAGDDYRATSSDPTVATVEVTPNPRVKITPVGPGTTTIRVDNLRSGERVEFDVTVEEPGNRPPTVTNPGSKAYAPGQAIEAFRITVTDADGDTVTVTVSGLPAGLTWSSETGRVSGTVAADAPARAYPVTVTANDGTSDAVTATFTITIATPTQENVPPVIANPGSKAYAPGQAIGAFRIAVTDADGDTVTVAVSGLPAGLAWSSETGMVSGTVSADAPAQAYTVTVTANDGVNDAVTATFTITIAVNSPPAITNPGSKTYPRRQMIEPFPIEVSDPDGDDVTVTVSGLPSSLEWSSSSGMVSGTVAWTAAARDYPVTVTANDGVNEAVTAEFRITVNSPPRITNPGNKEYLPGATIAAFPVMVTDANDRDTVTVTVSGLPSGLEWSSSSGMVSGTVSETAAGRNYPVTVTANDGVNEAVTAEFRITVKMPVTETLLVAADASRLVESSGVQGSTTSLENWSRQTARQAFLANPPTFDLQASAETAALAYCMTQGYQRATSVSATTTGAIAESAATGWGYSNNLSSNPSFYLFRAKRTSTWSATCERTVFRNP